MPFSPSILFLACALAASLLAAQQQTVAASHVPADPAPQAPPPSETPTTPLPPQKMGDLHMARKMYREAIDQYRLALDAVPVIWNKMGIAYHQLSELELARQHYEQAVKLKPNYAEAINNIGTIYYAKKDYKKAEKYYREALKHAPKSASIHSNLGTALFARRKYDEAMQAYQEALKLDPEIFEHRSTIGSMLLDRTVEERARFHFYLSKLYAKSGQNELALQYMRKAIEEGFKDRQKFLEDSEFQGLRGLPEFQELMAYQPRPL